MTELRVYLPVYDLQPQFAAYLSTPTRARGYPPFEGQHSLIIEVSPALAIHRISDLALKAAPDMEPGILFTERQFGLLELHSSDREEIDAAGDAILRGIGARAEDQLAPRVLFERHRCWCQVSLYCYARCLQPFLPVLRQTRRNEPHLEQF